MQVLEIHNWAYVSKKGYHNYIWIVLFLKPTPAHHGKTAWSHSSISSAVWFWASHLTPNVSIFFNIENEDNNILKDC